MAYAYVQAGTNNSTTAAAITASSITVSANNTLVVWIVTLNTGTQTVTGNSNTYTFVGSSALTNSVCLSAYFCQNANSGATAVATSDTGAFAIYAAEYSGIATSGGSLGSSFGTTGSFGLGANVASSGATGSITANAAAFAMVVDAAGIQSASPNSGTFNAGTTLTWVTRAPDPTWLTGSSVVDGRAEDIRVTVTGTVTATFGTTGNKQFTSGITGVFALSEGSPPPPPVPSRGPMPKQIYIMP